MDTFSLDHLSDTQFEEFCYDLLGELGFVNLDWRKGTGLDSSPSDRGRDIECEIRVKDTVDGSVRLEKWFVQCKQYKRGVPPKKLDDTIAWANAERPATLLFIVSNFLSNGAKDHLSRYREKNHPSYQIRYWERPKLEELTANHQRLLRKYNIPSEFSFISVLHPAHLLYIKDIRHHTLDTLFRILEEIDPKKRNHIFSWIYFHLTVMMRRNPPPPEQDTPQYFLKNEYTYDAFKENCYMLTQILPEHFIVASVISYSLQSSFGLGNIAGIDDRLEKIEQSNAFLLQYEHWSEEEKDATDAMLRDKGLLAEGSFIRDKAEIDAHIQFSKQMAQEYPGRVKENYQLYIYFCEEVIARLLQENTLP